MRAREIQAYGRARIEKHKVPVTYDGKDTDLAGWSQAREKSVADSAMEYMRHDLIRRCPRYAYKVGIKARIGNRSALGRMHGRLWSEGARVLTGCARLLRLAQQLP